MEKWEGDGPCANFFQVSMFMFLFPILGIYIYILFPFFQFGTWTIGRTCFFCPIFHVPIEFLFNIIIKILGSSRKSGNLIGFCYPPSGSMELVAPIREENMFEPLPLRKPKNGKLENLLMFNS